MRVEGGSSQGISYVIHSKSYEGSEDRARRQLESYKISAYVRGDTAWIVGEWEGGSPHKFSSEVNVTVPRNMEFVKIETEGGDVVTTGISGRLEAQSGGGAIHLDDIGGTVNAETVDGPGGGFGGFACGSEIGGAVLLQNLTSGSWIIGQPTSPPPDGYVYDGPDPDLTCKAPNDISGNVTTETGGGSIKLSSAGGPVKAETGGGGIELWGVPSAHVQTGAGPIVAKFISSRGERTDSVLETGVGDITIYLVPNINLTIRASIEASTGHRIMSDFPEIRVSSEGGQWDPKQVSAEGQLNGGGPVLKLRTSMGNIYIRRAQ